MIKYYPELIHSDNIEIRTTLIKNHTITLSKLQKDTLEQCQKLLNKLYCLDPFYLKELPIGITSEDIISFRKTVHNELYSDNIESFLCELSNIDSGNIIIASDNKYLEYLTFLLSKNKKDTWNYDSFYTEDTNYGEVIVNLLDHHFNILTNNRFTICSEINNLAFVLYKQEKINEQEYKNIIEYTSSIPKYINLSYVEDEYYIYNDSWYLTKGGYMYNAGNTHSGENVYTIFCDYINSEIKKLKSNTNAVLPFGYNKEDNTDSTLNSEFIFETVNVIPKINSNKRIKKFNLFLNSIIDNENNNDTVFDSNQFFESTLKEYYSNHPEKKLSGYDRISYIEKHKYVTTFDLKILTHLKMYCDLDYLFGDVPIFDKGAVERIKGSISAQTDLIDGIRSFLDSNPYKEKEYVLDILNNMKKLSINDVLVRICGFHLVVDKKHCEGCGNRIIITSDYNYKETLKNYILNGYSIEYLEPIKINELVSNPTREHELILKFHEM